MKHETPVYRLEAEYERAKASLAREIALAKAEKNTAPLYHPVNDAEQSTRLPCARTG